METFHWGEGTPEKNGHILESERTGHKGKTKRHLYKKREFKTWGTMSLSFLSYITSLEFVLGFCF